MLERVCIFRFYRIKDARKRNRKTERSENLISKTEEFPSFPLHSILIR